MNIYVRSLETFIYTPYRVLTQKEKVRYNKFYTYFESTEKNYKFISRKVKS